MKKLGLFFLNLTSDFVGFIFNVGIIAIIIAAFGAIVSAIGWIGVKCSTTLASLQPTTTIPVVGKTFAVGMLFVLAAVMIGYVIIGIVSIAKYFISVWKRSDNKE